MSNAEWMGRLQDDDERYQEIVGDAESFVGRLNDDSELAVDLARADVEAHLRTWFTDDERSGWEHDPTRSGPIGDGWFGTEWTFRGVHDRDGAFNGLPATGNDVVVRGFTLMGTQDGNVCVRRYVDWVGLFGQLRLSVNWRLPHQPDPVPDTPPE